VELAKIFSEFLIFSEFAFPALYLSLMIHQLFCKLFDRKRICLNQIFQSQFLDKFKNLKL
jgi:hypothetical protein